MSKTAELRQAFLDFFSSRSHRVMRSAPLVPLNDPSLLFTNAGMVPFKNYFTRRDAPPAPRLASAQKCLRAGGKHNDLDNVGFTARHQTFFEMLGNFSFGDYFKAEAIEFAWDFVRKEMALPPERLLATVYIDDDESFALWRKITGLPESRILKLAGDDNFWSMGAQGPCGPCSEIFYDHGEQIAGGPPGSPTADGDRFVEIWNLVFMQYETLADGSRRDLPVPSIDTGAGLERLSAIAHGSHDNYAIDVLRHLIGASAEISGKDADAPAHRASHRVIADHVRAAGFLIADGVLPANEGRGYVLRRILRRAMRHGRLLGLAEPFLWRLVGTLLTEMGSSYPELVRAQALIVATLQQEETRFTEMLTRGLKLLDDELAKVKNKTLSGAAAFRLYDTYGFPLDLTQDALRPRGINVDEKGFAAAMAEQKARARQNWAGSGEEATEQIWFALRERVPPTEFMGYVTTNATATVQALLVDGKEQTSVQQGQACALVLNQTPFYAEAGGQVGDIGTAESDSGARLKITDVQNQNGLFVHAAQVEAGELQQGDAVRLAIDAPRRADIRAHHSATHLLHKALKQVLGAHVTQKGSLVAADRLRFDFSHPKALTPDERAQIERIVNEQIRTNSEVRTKLMTPDAAIAEGAVALFGEKYGDEVRVLTMGEDGDEGVPFSVELCGGTHVARLGELMLFKLTGESAVGSGVRRVEALAGLAAVRYVVAQDALVEAVASSLKTTPAEIPNRVQKLLDERKELTDALAQAKRTQPAAKPKVETIGDIQLMAGSMEGVSPKELRALVDEGKKSLGSGVVALIGIADGKAGLVVGVSEDLTQRFDAVQLAQRAAAELGGQGGGGRRDMAQAGGPNPKKAAAALAAVRDALGG